MKTVLFVPGFQENMGDRNYKAVLAAIEHKGYKAVFIPINWKRTVIDDWVCQLEDIYKDYDPAETILAGFSYGAMTAFIAASHRQPDGLWLCSLSPYFKEDMPDIKPAWRRLIGKRRAESFLRTSFEELAPAVGCAALLFVGETEARQYPLVGRRAEAAHKALPGSRLIHVPHAKHDVSAKTYIESIQRNI